MSNLATDRATVEAAAAESQSLAEQAARTVAINLLQPWVTDTSKTNEQFVTALFGAFLQREASTTELNNWVATVQSQGRNQTLQSFASLPAVQELAGTLYREILWLTSDHLGTPRMISERSGSLTGVKRHDYLPFGEEIVGAIGGRTLQQGYSSDTVRQKFTHKERDIETGLDYFLARYYSNMQGRFTSIDAAGPDPTDPQTFNKYQYSLNNPLRFVDPDGRQAQEISKLTQSLRDYFAALVRRFQDQVNPEQAQQEGRRPGPFGNGDAALENYNRILGERVEFASDLIMLMDVTGAGTATRGFMRGNRTEMAIGMAGMVAMPLNEVFGVGKSALMSGRLLGGRIGTAEVGAQFSKNGDTLVAGIVGVFNKEGGASLGSTTRALVDSIVSYAKDQGLSKIEVQAIAVVNPKLEKLLIKQGFQQTTVVVEGEKVAAYTKTFIVQ